MAGASVICFQCSTPNPVLGSVGFREECFKCRADLHSCRNCAHHDSKVYNECRETQADVVREKDKANFCEYYIPGDGRGAGTDATQKLKEAAEALFKKNSS